ncbi:DUF4065 domain-containing protein [Gluconobacter frateurii]|uniref:Panacea domain-containing protein n=1 Tax=Gluconobacter frateurii TaxID=38308 RepID=UPI001F06B6A6|nr:type II toxin-antitoxin system antitoxin SocA domain-containing protein [Gluconobacter frateurii]UMM08417.1 DUF4065 domain-containing protein [Gluconobacter frateurii]
MHSASAVANRFLELAEDAGHQLTPMQVLKLVYLAHGWMLGLYHRPLISERIEAWKYGPVIPRLYDVMRHFRSSPVTEVLPCGDHIITDQEEDIIKQVYEIYGDLSGPALSRITHEKDTPWSQTYDPNGFGDEIPNTLIERYYSRKACEGA